MENYDCMVTEILKITGRLTGYVVKFIHFYYKLVRTNFVLSGHVRSYLDNVRFPDVKVPIQISAQGDIYQILTLA